MASSKSIMFPDGTTVELDDVASFSDHIPLDFYQYEGFKGEYDDPYLSDFVLLFEKKSADSLVGFNILDDERIAKLEDEKVSGVKFDKISEEEFSFEELLAYLQNKYASASIKEIDPVEEFVDREVLLFNEEDGREYARIQFVELGIPGTFVKLNG